MEIFTYLFGAGASAKALPTVANIPLELIRYHDRLKTISKKYLRDEKFNGLTIQETKIEVLNKLTDDLKELFSACKNSSSIDTLARKYYLTNDMKSLTKLKALIDNFFLYEQLNNRVDQRYDSLFAAILKGGKGENIKLPNNIKILTWNYDLQIDSSMANFHSNKNNDDIQKFLQIYPNRDLNYPDIDKFSAVKLNGTIGGRILNDKYYYPEFDLSMDKSLQTDILPLIIEDLLIRYYELSRLPNKYASILYSWENEELSKKIRQTAKDISQHTTYLIVIGYSFPIFNRPIDSEIINNMSRLKKVYIQSKEDTISDVVLRFKAISQRFSENSKQFPLMKITDEHEFYIPPEYIWKFHD